MDYFQIINEQCGTAFMPSKLVILSRNEDELEVRSKVSCHSHIVILYFSDFIADRRFLPAADVVFSSLEEKILLLNSESKIPWIFGLDALLSLWNPENIFSAYSAIRTMLDDATKHFHIISSSNSEYLDTIFSNSRYHDRLLRFTQNTQTPVYLVSKVCLLDRAFTQWMLEGQLFSCFHDYISNFEKGMIEETNTFIYTEAVQYPVATVDDRHVQVHTTFDFLHKFCSLDEHLSEDAITWMLKLLEGHVQPILPFLQRYFFPQGCTQQIICQTAIEIFQKLPLAQKEVLLWVLKKSVSGDSYLKYVLVDKNLSTANFLAWYISKPLECWNSPSATAFARERSQALSSVLPYVTGALETFLEQFKSITDISCCIWLNNGTISEKCEIIRRIMNAPSERIPACVRDNYPQLDAYLGEYRLGNSDLDAYFTNYRRQKLANRLDADFLEIASTVQYPPCGIYSRALALQKYDNDKDTVVIVVDALGAEFIPAIIGMAKNHSLDVESAQTVYVQLPTSTRFNTIEWPVERRWHDIKKLDEIIHNGAESQTGKSIEANIVAQLDVLEDILIPEICKALAKFKTVIVTSDHGASRLAVLAHRQGLSNNLALSDTGNAEDWRYTPAIPGLPVPSGAIDNLAGDYWIVKGYNRFSKKGGKLNELHGGLTWEEMLVPVIVFRQGAVLEMPQCATPKTEFETDEAFDEL